MVQKPLEHFKKYEIQLNLKTTYLLQSFRLSLMSEIFFLTQQRHSIKIASSYHQVLIILNTDIIHLESETALWIMHQKEAVSVKSLLLLSKPAGNGRNAGNNFT